MNKEQAYKTCVDIDTVARAAYRRDPTPEKRAVAMRAEKEMDKARQAWLSSRPRVVCPACGESVSEGTVMHGTMLGICAGLRFV